MPTPPGLFHGCAARFPPACFLFASLTVWLILLICLTFPPPARRPGFGWVWLTCEHQSLSVGAGRTPTPPHTCPPSSLVYAQLIPAHTRSLHWLRACPYHYPALPTHLPLPSATPTYHTATHARLCLPTTLHTHLPPLPAPPSCCLFMPALPHFASPLVSHPARYLTTCLCQLGWCLPMPLHLVPTHTVHGWRAARGIRCAQPRCALARPALPRTSARATCSTTFCRAYPGCRACRALPSYAGQRLVPGGRGGFGPRAACFCACFTCLPYTCHIMCCAMCLLCIAPACTTTLYPTTTFQRLNQCRRHYTHTLPTLPASRLPACSGCWLFHFGRFARYAATPPATAAPHRTCLAATPPGLPPRALPLTPLPVAFDALTRVTVDLVNGHALPPARAPVDTLRGIAFDNV